MILLLKSYPYRFVRTILSVPFCPIPFCPYTILSNTILSVYHFVHTILSVPFCPLPFCPRTGGESYHTQSPRSPSQREIYHDRPRFTGFEHLLFFNVRIETSPDPRSPTARTPPGG